MTQAKYLCVILYLTHYNYEIKALLCPANILSCLKLHRYALVNTTLTSVQVSKAGSSIAELAQITSSVASKVLDTCVLVRWLIIGIWRCKRALCTGIWMITCI